MGVTLSLIGIKETQSSILGLKDEEMDSESLDYIRSRYFLEQHLACVSFVLELNYEGLYELFNFQYDNSYTDIINYEERAYNRDRLREIGEEPKSKQALIDDFEAKWQKLQNNIGDVKELVNEFREAFKNEEEVMRRLSDTPTSIPGGYEDLSPRQSFQKVLDMYGPEAFVEFSEALDILSERGAVTVWLEEI